MELIINKSIFILFFISSILSLCTEAAPSKRFFSFDSPSPSPSPIEESSSTINVASFDMKSFLSTHFPTVRTSKVHSSLKPICAVTQNPTMCVTYIAPHMTGSVDFRSSLQVVIKSLSALVKDTSSLAKKVSKDRSTQSKVKKSLDICLEQYSKATSNLKKASAACSAKDFKKVNAMLVAAITNFGFSDEAFYKQGLAKSPLKDVNGLLTEIAGFGVDISIKLMKKK